MNHLSDRIRKAVELHGEDLTESNQPFTHAYDDEDRCYQMCFCSVCQTVQQCTPMNDFYGSNGEPLVCESCFRSRHGIGKPVGLFAA